MYVYYGNNMYAIICACMFVYGMYNGGGVCRYVSMYLCCICMYVRCIILAFYDDVCTRMSVCTYPFGFKYISICVV
jgi:hypothetical protein